jgi:hypothetical protein
MQWSLSWHRPTAAGLITTIIDSTHISFGAGFRNFPASLLGRFPLSVTESILPARNRQLLNRRRAHY